MSRYTDLSGCFSGLLYSWKLFFTMEDQHRHHFLVLRAMMSWSVVISLYIALCCAWGWCCLLGCESVQCSYSSSVVDCLGLAFYLCSDWKWAGAATYSGLYSGSCQFWVGLLKLESLLLHLAKAAMEQKPHTLCRAEMLLQQCQNAAFPVMVKDGLQPLLSGARPGLAHLPSTGLLQVFTVQFKSKIRFIKQLGFREQCFYGYVSGISELQSQGKHFYSTAIHCCPKDPLLWRRKGKEF